MIPGNPPHIPGKKPPHAGRPVEQKVIRRRGVLSEKHADKLEHLANEYHEGRVRAQFGFNTVAEEVEFISGTSPARGEEFDPKKHKLSYLVTLQNYMKALEDEIIRIERGPTTKARATALRGVLKTTMNDLAHWKKRAQKLGELSTQVAKKTEDQHKMYLTAVEKYRTKGANATTAERITMLRSILSRLDEYAHAVDIDKHHTPLGIERTHRAIDLTKQHLDRAKGKYTALLKEEIKHSRRRKK